jgi:orotate phosphoribosyltransferase
LALLQQYKADFITFLVRSEVLTFGDFITKSGRKTPYFVNTGRYKKGSQLGELGRYYAKAISDTLGTGFDNLYGPAYKGISLAVITAIALAEAHDHDVTVTYNRKEAKVHGEGGVLIGHQYEGYENIVIVEDVITAGTSVRESMALLKDKNNPNVLAVVVSVDRMERGSGELSAVAEVKANYGIEAFAIVTIKEVLAFLHNKKVDGKVYIDDAMKANMEAYLAQYGQKV